MLFVRNLLPITTENKIKDLFESLGEEDIERVKKNKDYAFVHFLTREAAEKALRNSAGKCLDGSQIHVEWSKPVDKNMHNTRKHLTKLLSQGVPTMPL